MSAQTSNRSSLARPLLRVPPPLSGRHLHAGYRTVARCRNDRNTRYQMSTVLTMVAAGEGISVVPNMFANSPISACPSMLFHQTVSTRQIRWPEQHDRA